VSRTDAYAEALDLVAGAARNGIPLRLMGGLAVRHLCPTFPPRARPDQDLDLVSRRRSSRDLSTFLATTGYDPDKHFNALNGHKQLYFRSTVSGRSVDVLLEAVEMCHTLELGGRIDLVEVTIEPTDLLLTKLQVVELTDKDLTDLVYLLAGLDLTSDGGPGIDTRRFESVVGHDWGWWKTVTTNLATVIERLARADVPVPAGAPNNPTAHARELLELAQATPKSMRWKARAAIGTRVQWFNLPEVEAH
jgi:hypothetical protein